MTTTQAMDSRESSLRRGWVSRCLTRPGHPCRVRGRETRLLQSVAAHRGASAVGGMARAQLSAELLAEEMQQDLIRAHRSQSVTR